MDKFRLIILLSFLMGVILTGLALVAEMHFLTAVFAVPTVITLAALFKMVIGTE